MRNGHGEMDLKQLRTFRAVAELGSLSKAADRLRAAQPALSRHIKLLERDLRVCAESGADVVFVAGDIATAGVAERLGLVADDPARLGLAGLGVEVLRAELLMYDAVRRLGITPDVLAGYSLGEWAAWAAAGRASAICDSARSSCAAETNQASNADGGK